MAANLSRYVTEGYSAQPRNEAQPARMGDHGAGDGRIILTGVTEGSTRLERSLRGYARRTG